jgi:penicillin-insensitive murein endopeptidase
VLDGKAGTVQPQLAPRVAQLLRLTANDQRVARVFVNPIIKRELCASTSGERAWLGKIRPWYGHDDHFHVRLGCPSDSSDCLPQAPVPAGDGCGEELAWWFSDEARADREDARKKYQNKVVRGPRVPEQCFALIGRRPR